MDYKKNTALVTAIVPIYNEADRIGAVLDVLSTYAGFLEVLVIDDGSTDESESIVKQYTHVTYHRQSKNEGKAKAMDIGVKLSKSDIVFFCDGDINGLTHHMLDEILTPVINGQVDMFIAMRNHKIFFLHTLVPLVPLLGGERALTKELWITVPSEYKQKFRIEAGLNFYAKYYGKGFDMKLFRGLTQTIKEKKYGFWSGLKKRLSMTWDVSIATINLQFIDVPKDVIYFRRLFGASLINILLIAIGLTIFIALHMGPVHFILTVFAEELVEDPNPPLIHFLMNLIARTSHHTLYIVAYIIVISNTFICITNFWRLITNLRSQGYNISRYLSKTKTHYK